MVKFFVKIKKNKTAIFCIVTFCILSFLIGNFSLAQAKDISQGVGLAVATLLSWIAWVFIMVFGLLLTLLIKILVNVAQFNNIIDVEAVKQGWVIVRDLTNMFFILILLVIAFATILRIENYSVKKMLPKLLIMAILINFSRTIFGLLIDFSQVIMLTFVNSFAEYGPSNFINMFQTDKIMIMWEGRGDVNSWSVVVAIITGVIALIITNIVILVMLAVLIMRIVMLWIYTILSPFVFLGFAFPPLQKYTGQIWEDFNKQLVVGPVLAFFIWLALATASESSNKLGAGAMTGGAGGTEICAGIGKLFCEGSFQTFIITIGLLMGGLMVAQQMGGAAGSIAGKGVGWAQKAPAMVGKAGLWGAGWAARKLKVATAVELRPTKIISGVREALEDKTRREEIAAEAKSAAALKKGGLGGLIKGLGASRDMTEAMAHGFLWRRAWQPGRGEKKGALWQTWRAGNLRKEITKKQKEKSKTTDKKEIKKIEEDIGKVNEELKKVRTPYTYYAEQKRNASVKEAMAKIGDNDNEDELIAAFNDAMARKDKEMAAAIVLSASKVSHLNEIIQSQRSTKDVYNEKGEKVIEKGGYLRQGGHGLNELFKQKFIEELGMSEQEAFNYQSQASGLAKSVGHFNLTESIGVENGMLFQREVPVQQARARAELRKVDPERSIRNFNRLSWGDEIQYDDPETGKIKREFRLNKLGKMNFLEWAGTIDAEISRERFNKNAAMNMARDKKSLLKFIDDLESQGIVDFWKKDAKTRKMEKRKYRDVANELIKYGENVARSEDSIKELEEIVSGSPEGASEAGVSGEAVEKERKYDG